MIVCTMALPSIVAEDAAALRALLLLLLAPALDVALELRRGVAVVVEEEDMGSLSELSITTASSKMWTICAILSRRSTAFFMPLCVLPPLAWAAHAAACAP